jgi:hypothetical protein
MFFLASEKSLSISIPAILTSPSVLFARFVSIDIRVVLPAQLCHNRAKKSHDFTSKLTHFNTWLSPYFL